MVGRGGHGQGVAGAGLGGNRGENAAVGTGHKAVRVGNGFDLHGGAARSVAHCDGGGAAAGRSGEQPAFGNAAAAGAPGGAAVGGDGNVVGIYSRIAQLSFGSGQKLGTQGSNVVVIQLAGGSGAGYQENLCGYGAFTASGRLVDSAGRSGAGKGGGQRGGAAAVQAYGGGAAQLQ